MNNLAKITKLLKKGEKIVVVNEEAEPQFVVMGVFEYEKMISNNGEDIKDLTEEELLSRINRDIAVWKSTQTNDDIEINTDNFIKNTQETENFKPIGNQIEGEEDEDEDKYYFEPVDEEE